jgi:hypothetical protein
MKNTGAGCKSATKKQEENRKIIGYRTEKFLLIRP